MSILWLRHVSVHYCTVVVVESGLICVSLGHHCGRVSLSKKGGGEEEVKSICPLISGSFTPYRKVLFSEAKVKEAAAYVIHQGGLWLWDQNSFQMISLSHIKKISSFPGDFYSEMIKLSEVEF